MLEQYLKSMKKISSLLDLEFNYSSARYNFETGLPLEGALRNFFVPYFPKRYGFSSGYLVDEEGSISNQCDWIIYDAINIPPLITNHNFDTGTNWLPFNGAFGSVEIKRTLNEDVLAKACTQINNTKLLKRDPTNLLHIHPVKTFPSRFFGVPPEMELKTTNKFYSGIYAYSIEESYKDPETIMSDLVGNKFGIPFENLPDFIAVHGHFFIRKSIHMENKDKSGWGFSYFPYECNGYSWLETKDLTSGFFYFDLITQFANMDISAAYQLHILTKITEKLIGDMKNNGRLFQGKDYLKPKNNEPLIE